VKIDVSADIEGVTGVAHWDETEIGKRGYEAFRAQMAARVRAAGEGAVRAGAHEILVKDAPRPNSCLGRTARRSSGCHSYLSRATRRPVAVTYQDHPRAYRASFYPGASLRASRTVRFVTADFMEVLRFLLFVA